MFNSESKSISTHTMRRELKGLGVNGCVATAGDQAVYLYSSSWLLTVALTLRPELRMH